MSEPKVICISAGVSDRALFAAIKRLPSDRYPKRLAVIHREMAQRKERQAA